MSEAIKPDYFKPFRQVINEDVTPEKEEQQIAWMAKTPGWKHMDRFIRDLQQSLEIPAKQAMENGCSYEDIGRKTIVAQLSKEVLQKILDRVNDAKEATDK